MSAYDRRSTEVEVKQTVLAEMRCQGQGKIEISYERPMF